MAQKQHLKMADVITGDVVHICKDLFDGDGNLLDSVGLAYAAHAINSHDELVSENERLREFERDAMRYRFLRECHWSESPICAVVDPRQMVKLGADCPSTSRLDDFIDELMS